MSRRLSTLTVSAAIALGALPAAAAAAPWNFRTPSGNIGCDMRAKDVRCDILDYSYRPPARPASCQFDWGGSFWATARKRGLGCYSDTVVPPAGAKHVARYGTTVYRNGFRCAVTRSGVTCTNPAGHGFFVSRQKYRLF